MKLYELSDQYLKLQYLVEEHEGNDEQHVERLLSLIENVKDDLEVKAIDVAKVIKNLEADALAIKEAEAKMEARRKTKESQAANLRAYLLMNMVKANITMLECPYFKITIKDNQPSVIVDDIKKVPPEYLVTKDPQVNKRLAMDDMKQGVIIDGLHAESRQTLNIK